MKFGQVIDYNKKKLYEVKAISLQLSFNIPVAYNKKKHYKLQNVCQKPSKIETYTQTYTQKKYLQSDIKFARKLRIFTYVKN